MRSHKLLMWAVALLETSWSFSLAAVVILVKVAERRPAKASNFDPVGVVF